MDQKGDQNSMIIINDQKQITPHHEAINNKTTPSSLKKSKGSKNFFKVALFMMRGRSRKSKMLAVDGESKSTWRKLVGSMRPLHLQDNQSPPHDNNNNNNNNNINDIPKMITAPSPMEIGNDGFESASEFANSPSPASSRYASATGLNEMVKEGEEEVVKENNNNNDTGEGDEMIDAKAEEFIAQFYRQIRLQRLNDMNSYYEEISKRSLGL